MSKKDGWNPERGCEWRKSGEKFKAEICKLAGTAGVPFWWSVYPLPRSGNVDPRGRYMPLGKGYEKTLAIAKQKAEAVIAAISA
jgi:hypothetical protein